MKPEGETPPQVQEGTAPVRPSVSAPARKRMPPPEATQELQALDVVELVKTPLAPSIRPSIPSNSSIAPVGLDLKPQRAAAADEEANPTMEIRLPVRRRRLGVVVVGALSACALILVAAGVARVVHASSTPDPQDTPAQASQSTATQPPDTAAASPPSTPAPAPGTTAAAGAGGATTGTVRLDRPAYPGKVWLDGKKLSSSSSLVSCGTHQIKVGFRRTHSIDVPCGGELGVSK
jgi:hypothetical protein